MFYFVTSKKSSIFFMLECRLLSPEKNFLPMKVNYYSKRVFGCVCVCVCVRACVRVGVCERESLSKRGERGKWPSGDLKLVPSFVSSCYWHFLSFMNKLSKQKGPFLISDEAKSIHQSHVFLLDQKIPPTDWLSVVLKWTEQRKWSQLLFALRHPNCCKNMSGIGIFSKQTLRHNSWRSHGLVVRSVACEARGTGFDSSSDQMFFFSPRI